MSHAAVAHDAINRVFLASVRRRNCADQCFVALQTIIQNNIFTHLAHLNRLWKILKSEGAGVREAVLGFGGIFANQIMRGVAAIARGNRLVARVRPALVLIPHNMAVHTCQGVIRKIRPAFGKIKRICANPQQNASHGAYQKNNNPPFVGWRSGRRGVCVDHNAKQTQ